MSKSGSAKSIGRGSIHTNRQGKAGQNRHGSQIVISNTQAKTPLAAHLSTAVTTGSQKNLHMTLKE